jgi:phage replication-related protein YjqB (UPF0714/DUF867 family)
MPIEPLISFEQLAFMHPEGRDFIVHAVRRASPYAIVAPHGGKIEPGTSQLAKAVAGEEHSLYVFEGLRSRNNTRLHIPSEAFDEPRCLEIVRCADTVVTLHGMRGKALEVSLGGLDEALLGLLEQVLNDAGFKAGRATERQLAGRHANNLCNRGRSGRGCQLEISSELRRVFLRELVAPGLARPEFRFRAFVGAVRSVLRESVISDE